MFLTKNPVKNATSRISKAKGAVRSAKPASTKTASKLKTICTPSSDARCAEPSISGIDFRTVKNVLVWRKGQKFMSQSEYDEKVRVIVTIEPKADVQACYFVMWRGNSYNQIVHLASKAYSNCVLQFGRAF